MIHREDKGGVAVLRMEHGKANAIDVTLFEELEVRLDEIEASPEVRAVVLTGTGGMFSAGVDLFQVIEGGSDYLDAFVPRIGSSLLRLFTYPKPVVAAVNGHALAGGFILAQAADYRVMSEGKGKLGLTELLVGVTFPVAALEIVRFQAPSVTVQNLVLTGRTMQGPEALELGLVDEIAPAEEAVERAVAEAARRGALFPPAYAFSKSHLRRPAVEQIERYSAVLDDEVVALWSDPETIERIRQFLHGAVGKKG